MFESIEMGIGLEVVRWFQTFRFELLDYIAMILDFANDGLFFVVVIGAIYWVYDKHLGIRMLFALIIIGLVTLFFKEILARPRPYELIDSGVFPLVLESTYGIPSGHASITLVVWGYFALWMRKRAITIIVIIYVILMGLSRMYLGVHFPQDVIAGWLLGLVVLWAFATYAERVGRWWHTQSLRVQLGLPIAIGILSMLFFFGSIDGLTLAGLLIGVGTAVVIENHSVNFSHKEGFKLRLVQFVIGATLALIIVEGLDIVFDAIEPPRYIFVEEDIEATAVLQSQVGLEGGTATEVCIRADELDIQDEFEQACEVQITPLSASLRVIRYALLAIFAVSIIPYLSIRLNLMEQIESEK